MDFLRISPSSSTKLLEASSKSFPLGKFDVSFFKITSAFAQFICDSSETFRRPIAKQTLNASYRFSNSSLVTTSESWALFNVCIICRCNSSFYLRSSSCFLRRFSDSMNYRSPISLPKRMLTAPSVLKLAILIAYLEDSGSKPKAVTLSSSA